MRSVFHALCLLSLLACPVALGVAVAAPGEGDATGKPRPTPRPVTGEARVVQPDRPERRYLTVGLARYFYFSPTTVEGQGGLGDVTLESHFVRVKLAAGHFFRRTGTVLAGALGWDLLHLGSDSGPRWTDLHHLNLRLAIGQRVARGWMVMAFARPGVASDLRGFHSRDLQLSAGALVRWGYRPRLTFAAGVLYNNGVFGHLVLPILHVRYLGRRWRGIFEFPHRFQLWYVAAPWVEVGLLARFVAGVFGVHASAGLADRVSALYVCGGPAVRFFFWRGLFTMVEGGYAVRHLQLYQGSQRSHTRLDFRGAYLSLSAGYTI